MVAKLVPYIRVSTDKQGKSGLGLEAQEAAVKGYAQMVGGQIISPFYIEVESGKQDNRPELHKAIAKARAMKAVLVVAKLDRLARSVSFVSTLMKSGLDFVCCDNPQANKLTIHILAAVAEAEVEAISIRTKEALKAYKARGGLLGGARPECRNLTKEATIKGTVASAKVRRANADAYLMDMLPIIKQMSSQGCSLWTIADHLNAQGYTTRKGCSWAAGQVYRALQR